MSTEGQETFTNVDPTTLPEQLQPIYKSLLADYTRKRQEDSNRAKAAELQIQEMENQMQELQSQLEEYKATNQMWVEWSRQIAEIPEGEEVQTEVPEKGQAKVRKRTEDERLTVRREKELEDLRNQVSKLSTALDMYLQIDDLRHQYKDLDPKRVIDTAMELRIADLKKARDIAYRDEDLKAEVERQVQERLKELEEKERMKVLDGRSGVPSDLPFKLPEIEPEYGQRPFEKVTQEVLAETLKQGGLGSL